MKVHLGRNISPTMALEFENREIDCERKESFHENEDAEREGRNTRMADQVAPERY